MKMEKKSKVKQLISDREDKMLKMEPAERGGFRCKNPSHEAHVSIGQRGVRILICEDFLEKLITN